MAEPMPTDEDRRHARLRALGLAERPADDVTDALLDLVADLRASERRLADFSRASGDWLWETDATLTLTWLSASFTDATGESAAGHLGGNLAHLRLYAGAGPDNAPDAVAALLHRRAPLTRVLTLLSTARGDLKVSNSAVPVFDDAGQFAGYRGTARDVTAQVDAVLRADAQAIRLRQSEERWELAARATGIGVAELDLDTGTLHMDDRALANHGITVSGRPLTIDDWLRDVHPQDLDRVRGDVADAVARCGRLESRYRIVGTGGATRMLEIVARATPGPDGRTQTIVGTCRDVTQQVQTEQLLRDKESAERASRAKSEFLSRMSHELRTPLNGIIGFTQLMSLDRANPLAPEQQRRVDSVHRAGRHLLGLINDVLDLARIESSDYAVQPEPVDLARALDACLALIAPLARDARVVLPAPPAAPCWVRADRRALDQVLMNLLSNAIKYNRAGGRVGLALHDAHGRLRLEVSDEGAGLTADQQARLFQHFERLGAETGPIEGTGLGLVISLDLARAMGAELGVRSEPGRGSVFTLTLERSAAPGPAEPADATDAGAAQAPVAACREVLYIEDERLNVILMEEVFRTHPEWTLTVAEDGAEGLAMARARRPHLVLVDMNLPDTTGLALIRELRGDPATQALRCIALSADAMSEQIEAALAAGFDEYWTKPIDVPRMLEDLSRRLA